MNNNHSRQKQHRKNSMHWDQAKTATGSQKHFRDTIASCRKDPVVCRETGANKETDVKIKAYTEVDGSMQCCRRSKHRVSPTTLKGEQSLAGKPSIRFHHQPWKDHSRLRQQTQGFTCNHERRTLVTFVDIMSKILIERFLHIKMMNRLLKLFRKLRQG